METEVKTPDTTPLLTWPTKNFDLLKHLKGEPFLTTLYIDLSTMTDDLGRKLTRKMDNFWWETWQAVNDMLGYSVQMFANLLWIETFLREGFNPKARGLLFIVDTAQELYRVIELPFSPVDALEYSPWPNLYQLQGMIRSASVHAA